MNSGKPYTPLNPVRQARRLLRQWLETGGVVLMDGAMGTELLRRQLKRMPEIAARMRFSGAEQGITALETGAGTQADQSSANSLSVSTSNSLPLGEMLAAFNACQPDWVQAIHRAYLRAGAQCLLTNTFLAWPRTHVPTATRYYRQINRTAVALAREITQSWPHPVPIIASIGPWPDDSPDSVEQCLQQMRCLQLADALLLETQSSLTFVDAVLSQLRGRITRPILVSFTFRRHGKRVVTWPQQHEPEEVAQWAEHHRDQVCLLGVNCGYLLEPEDVVAIVKRYRRHTSLPLLARPNAGPPSAQGTRFVYPQHHRFLEQAVPPLLEAGASWIGGCCGSTPGDIAAMRKVLRKLVPSWCRQLAQ
jgi:methionine synthase I (cobalamin-dependent)